MYHYSPIRIFVTNSFTNELFSLRTPALITPATSLVPAKYKWNIMFDQSQTIFMFNLFIYSNPDF